MMCGPNHQATTFTSDLITINLFSALSTAPIERHSERFGPEIILEIVCDMDVAAEASRDGLTALSKMICGPSRSTPTLPGAPKITAR
jgi:hypothetical protein